MSEAKSSEDQAKRAAAFAGVALFGLVLTVACATFTLTYHGLYGYGHDVTKLGRFAVVIPIGVDGLALVGIAASFVLAHAPLRVRAYAWLVFGIGSLASIAGQIADAQARALRWQGWVGSAFWPVGLALAAHLAVVTWRWRSRAQDEQPEEMPDSAPETPTSWKVYVAGDPARGPVKIGVTQDPSTRIQVLRWDTAAAAVPEGVVCSNLEMLFVADGSPRLERQLHARFQKTRIQGEWFAMEPAEAVREVAAAVADQHAPATPTRRVSRRASARKSHPERSASSAARREEARRRYVSGESCASIAKTIEGNPSKRTVELWTKDLRGTSLSAVSGAGVGSVSDLTVRSGVSGPLTVPVNGAKVPAAVPPHRT